jgi:glycosyltransferase involved in cell wall biosynthesis
MKDLSILIPSRNEMFLNNTIQDILLHKEANTEVIVVLDGQWAVEPIPQNENVNVIYTGKVVGQRAATNLACSIAQGKYVMKVDAHCAFDQGFDRKMLEAFAVTGDNTTLVPIMRNLWVFDWKCYKCGWKRYQGRKPEKCEQCGRRRYLKRKMMWIGKHNPQSTSYCFDSEPHFKYFEAWKHREPYVTDKREKGLTETMSLQGSCFMCTKKMYQELNLCDESFGSWGNQGIEVACKTWLSGGQVLCNHKTWYAHLFRTQGGDFGFPYDQHGKEVQKTKEKVRDLFFNNKWDKQVRQLRWLLDKFAPVPGWSEADLEKIK